MVIHTLNVRKMTATIGDGAAICDYCGKKMHNTVYLIYILGMAYCPQCFNEWQKNSHRYEDDIKLQNENHINWYKNHKFDVIE